MTDAELLHRYQQHADQTAFAQLVERYSGLVYHTALRRTGNAETARDISQAVFALVAERAHRLKGGDGLAGWLHRTAVLHARNAFRKEESRRRLMQKFEDSAASGAPGRTEALHPALPYLDEALGQLPVRDRDVLMAHYFHGRTYREIGILWRESEAAVQKRALRALQKLSHRLQRFGICVPVAALAAGLSLVLQQPAPAAVVNTFTLAPATVRPAAARWPGWSAGRAAVLLGAATLSGTVAFGLSRMAKEESGAAHSSGKAPDGEAAKWGNTGAALAVPRPPVNGWQDAVADAAQLLRTADARPSEAKAAWILTALQPGEFAAAIAWAAELPGDDKARDPLAGLLFHLWARHEPLTAWMHFRRFPRKESWNEPLMRHGSSVFLKLWSSDPAGCMAALSNKENANEPAVQMAVRMLQSSPEKFEQWKEALVKTPAEDARMHAAALAVGAFPPGDKSAAFFDWVAGIPFTEPGRQEQVLRYLAGTACHDEEIAGLLGRWMDGLSVDSAALQAMQSAILQSDEDVRLAIIRAVRRPDILNKIQETL